MYIESDNLTIPGLNRFKGKKAEIIILINDDYETGKKWPKKFFIDIYGFMKDDHLANPSELPNI
jgi:hypothetical protein